MSTTWTAGCGTRFSVSCAPLPTSLTARWKSELDQLGGRHQRQPMERHQRALAELERRQQLSVTGKLALADGATELMAQVEHDLRDRLRTAFASPSATSPRAIQCRAGSSSTSGCAPGQ